MAVVGARDEAEEEPEFTSGGVGTVGGVHGVLRKVSTESSTEGLGLGVLRICCADKVSKTPDGVVANDASTEHRAARHKRSMRGVIRLPDVRCVELIDIFKGEALQHPEVREA